MLVKEVKAWATSGGKSFPTQEEAEAAQLRESADNALMRVDGLMDTSLSRHVEGYELAVELVRGLHSEGVLSHILEAAGVPGPVEV